MKKFFVLISVSIMFLYGCSSVVTAPGTPDIYPDESRVVDQSGAGHACLGYYIINVNPGTKGIDVTPLRDANLHLNVTGTLNATMGVSAVGVPSEHDPPNGIFTFDVTLTHPFGTKPQLSGFDVKGILITPGTLSIGGFGFAGLDEPRLLNADGYTRWWNPTEFTESGFFGYTQGTLASTSANELTALINPFKYFADVLDATSSMNPVLTTAMDADGGRGIFTNTSSNTRRYTIKFPMNPGPQITYGYAIDASWATPTVNPPAELPDDFPINANQPEPYYVETEPAVNTLFYDSESGLYGGTLVMNTDIYDWQGQLNNNVGAEINMVQLYSPSLFNGPVTGFDFGEIGTYFRYNTYLTGIPVITGTESRLIYTRVETTGGNSYDQGFGTPSPTDVITSWQVSEITIEDPPCETDLNNDLASAVDIDLIDSVADYLCYTSDQEDWYRFEIPSSSTATGSIKLNIDADTHELSLTEPDGSLVVQGYNVSPGIEVIDLEINKLHPGEYYLQVEATMFTPAGPGALKYYLETNITVEDITPVSPVDVTPESMACEADWVGVNSPWIVTTGINGAYAYESGVPVPNLLSIIQDDGFARPVLYNQYLYYWENFSGPAGIDVIDYTDWSNPVHHEDIISISDSVEAIAVSDSYIYVAHDTGSNSYVDIYDYSVDPFNPTLVNTFSVQHNVMKMGLIDPEGDPGLIAITSSNMSCYDVSNPNSVIPKTILLNPVNSINMDISTFGGIIVKTVLDQGTDSYFQSYTYSNVNDLVSIGIIPIPGYGQNVDANGGYAYISNGNDGITIVDVFTPIIPEIVGSVQTLSSSRDIAVDSEQIVNLQSSVGFQSFTIVDPENPVISSTTDCLNSPVNGVLTENYGYFVEGFSDTYGAVKVVNISDPSNATLDFTFWDTDSLNNIATNGTVLAVGSQNANYLRFFDLAQPDMPDQYQVLTLTQSIKAMAMTETTLYVGLSNGTMKIYDIHLIPNTVPHPDWTMPFSHDIREMLLHGNNLYITSAITDDVFIVDISSPFDPVQVHQISAVDTFMDISIADNTLYSANLSRMLIHTLDNSGIPTDSWTYYPSYAPNIRHIASENYYSFVSDASQRPIAMNVWPPDSATELGPVFGTGPSSLHYGLIVKDGWLYELRSGLGLRIYDLY